MKTKMLKPACGIASVALAAFIFAACDSDSPSAPTGGDEKSSAVESTDASSSSNGDVPPESSNGEPASSETVPESSSDIAENSSNLLCRSR